MADPAATPKATDQTGSAGAEVDFYASLPLQSDFAALVAEDSFAPVPDDWLVGTADIVASTDVIARGGYKTVNMIGASVVAALSNALEGRPFAFVFGGDGASFAVPGADRQVARQTLAALRCWAEEEFAIPLRAALIPVTEIRAAGADLRLARFSPAPGMDYAMFAGGGLAWAEARMKDGAFAVDPAAPGARPDLDGLSCRWSNLRAQNGLILSLVVQQAPDADPAGFRDVAAQIVEIAAHLARGGHPIPPTGPRVRWPPAGLGLEARATHGTTPTGLRKARLLVSHLMIWVLMRSGLRLPRFDPRHYAARVSANADFRKFDDGLKMTLDCDAATRDRITAVLETGAAAGFIRYGLFEQDEALVTCFVPSVTREDHVHFVDGAAGGYTRAALQLKSR